MYCPYFNMYCPYFNMAYPYRQIELENLIKQFAQDHATITMSLLARWPDIVFEDREKEAKYYFKILLDQMELFARKYNIVLTPQIRGRMLLETFLNSLSVIVGTPQLYENSNQYQYQRDKIFSRVEQIINLILRYQNIDENIPLKIPDIATSMVKEFEVNWDEQGVPIKFDLGQLTKTVEVAWGQHGAHFPG